MPEIDIAKLLADARLPERTVDLCLRGDLQADFEDLTKQLAKAKEASRTSLADGGEAAEITERIEALREQMRGATVTVRLRAMPRRDWAKMEAEHPPREGDRNDKARGVNNSTFNEAAVRACLVEPELGPGQFEALFDVVTDFQWWEVVNAVWQANRGAVDVPFLPVGLRTSRSSDET
jgi:hypothetical protein